MIIPFPYLFACLLHVAIVVVSLCPLVCFHFNPISQRFLFNYYCSMYTVLAYQKRENGRARRSRKTKQNGGTEGAGCGGGGAAVGGSFIEEPPSLRPRLPVFLLSVARRSRVSRQANRQAGRGEGKKGGGKTRGESIRICRLGFIYSTFDLLRVHRGQRARLSLKGPPSCVMSYARPLRPRLLYVSPLHPSFCVSILAAQYGQH